MMSLRVTGLQNEILAAQNVLAELPDHLIDHPTPIDGFGTLGQQFRHVINFVEVLLRDYEAGCIDFTNRDRDPILETDKNYILKRLKLIHDQLNELRQKDPDHSLTSVFMPLAEGAAVVDKTTLGAAVNQVSEHTNHHIAMIKMLAGMHGVRIKSAAGIATSTIAFT